MSTPAPDSKGRSIEPGVEVKGRELNGSTPRVVVTRGALPRADLGSTSRRLFRGQPRLGPFLRSELSQIKNMKLWRDAVLEAIFTGMWVLASILITSASVNWGNNLPGRTILVVSVFHVVLFFIYITTAVRLSDKDGEIMIFPNFNPCITLLLMLSRIQGLVGGLLVIIFQCVGAIFGSFAVKELLPQDRIDLFMLGGCFGRRTVLLPNGTTTHVGLSDHKYFLCEFIFSFSFLYVTTLLMTPRKLKVVGPNIVIFLTSLNIGFNVYLAASLRQGYSGSMFNPARCLGPAVAYGKPLWDRLWQPFFAPFVASFAVAFLFATVPDDHEQLYVEKKDLISQIRLWSRRPTRYGSGDFEAGSSSLDPDMENNTVYEVPSAGRLFSASPETPATRPPSATAHEV